MTSYDEGVDDVRRDRGFVPPNIDYDSDEREFITEHRAD